MKIYFESGRAITGPFGYLVSKVLHIKDNKELGQSGMVGFDAIFQNTKAAGTKFYVVEVENYNFKPIESVEKSFRYLQNSPFVKK